MEMIISGNTYVLGDDIDTDQIIPAEYLSYNPADPKERKFFGMYALSGVPEGQRGLPDGRVPFVAEGQCKSPYAIVIGGRNFGCGSSREHAPLAMAEAGIQIVVATFYARIFYRNCVNGGYLLPCTSTERLVDQIRTGDECEVDISTSILTDKTTGKGFKIESLGDIRPIVEAGGVFDYARQANMLK